MADYPFVLKVMSFLAEHQMCDDVWWRVDGEYAPLTFFFNCNDVFCWATADGERITEENFPVLVQAATDIAEVDRSLIYYCDLLFCARIKQMRPQNAMYKHIPRVLWPLFDACGPEREPDELNPVGRP